MKDMDKTEEATNLPTSEISETPEEEQLDTFLEEETHVPKALKDAPVD